MGSPSGEYYVDVHGQFTTATHAQVRDRAGSVVLALETVDVSAGQVERELKRLSHGITPEKQAPLDGISLVTAIDGKETKRGKPMGFWKFPGGGISTPSDKWMREELAAQKAGKDYHDEKRLFKDAAEITKQFPEDQRQGHAAWTDWPWKLHRISGKKKDGQPTLELYHLVDDPMEATNLADQHPDRVATMCKALEDWQGSVIDSLNGEDYE